MKFLKVIFKSGRVYDYPVENEIKISNNFLIIKNKDDYAKIWLNSVASYVVIYNVNTEVHEKTS
ncbi:hypothetical protein SAMN00017477_0883 [Peptoniphilus asaccharolyticus DSM 20463]|uniref:Uncharacterized protein n=1 Tax=Peptoniphilus asaccharolyticus DSM 20463 TaxID=573058 RepID=A0A1W1UZ34_PEPAS|nr:hypothetical protein [Peptoniphilus asaccharolyticus]MBL7575378.1 hypothetical protein [Peptoniphilus asaccharolyticus]SMB86357.1 hypothetical protein SAMN00017477_0883 [Peptoniphilus asaccharolyticus DSM 20463]